MCYDDYAAAVEQAHTALVLNCNAFVLCSLSFHLLTDSICYKSWALVRITSLYSHIYIRWTQPLYREDHLFSSADDTTLLFCLSHNSISLLPFLFTRLTVCGHFYSMCTAVLSIYPGKQYEFIIFMTLRSIQERDLQLDICGKSSGLSTLPTRKHTLL